MKLNSYEKINLETLADDLLNCKSTEPKIVDSENNVVDIKRNNSKRKTKLKYIEEIERIEAEKKHCVSIW